MNGNYQSRIDSAKTAIAEADAILIGGGAGLSAASGLTYSGTRFEQNFKEFIAKYGMTDMYSAGFYPFAAQEKWAYWSRHIKMNRYDAKAGKVYLDLFKLVQSKAYFVITTNVDGQFYKGGFDWDKVFAVQGDYGKLQCARACHDKLYNNKELVLRMVAEQNDCKISSNLVPKCSVCGGDMEVNIRKNIYFLEDYAWREAKARFESFIANGWHLVLLELGVGYNTPGIIKFPFEQIIAAFPNATLVRINKDYPEVSKLIKDKTIVFDENLEEIIAALL